jgi:hypothetical protein
MRRAHVLVTLAPGLAAWLGSFSPAKAPALDPEEMDVAPELLDLLAVGVAEDIRSALVRSKGAVESITKSAPSAEADVSLSGALKTLGTVQAGLKGLWGRLTKPKAKPDDPTAPKLAPISDRVAYIMNVYGHRNLLAGDETSKQLLAGAVKAVGSVVTEAASKVAGAVSEAVPYISAVKALGELLASTVELARTVETLLTQKLKISQQLVLTAEAGVDEMTRSLHDACVVFTSLRKQAGDARTKMAVKDQHSFPIGGMLSQATLEALDMGDDGAVMDKLGLHMGAQLASAFAQLEKKLASLFDRHGRCTVHFATMGLTKKADEARRDALAKLRDLTLPVLVPGKDKAAERAELAKQLFPLDGARGVPWSEAEVAQLAGAAPIPTLKKDEAPSCPWGRDVVMDIKLATARKEDGEHARGALPAATLACHQLMRAPPLLRPQWM